MLLRELSIIIPTRRLGLHIDRCVAACEERLPGAEVIVVVAATEGAIAEPAVTRSTTARSAIGGPARILHATAGRGPQCNAGARFAQGSLLLFLHDDSILPDHAGVLMDDAFAAPAVELACFRLRFDDPHWLLGVYAWFSRFDSILTSFGDQGILVRRRVFDALGGFPDWPLFEDVELLRRARRRARIHKLDGVVTTSAVRFRRNGILRQQMLNAGLILRYLLGAQPSRLAEVYERGR
jgi:rSAM/selenodomain-associated transferase 2